MPAIHAFYISRVFLIAQNVLPQPNTRLRLLRLLYNTDATCHDWQKTIKHALSMFYALIKHSFRPIHRILSILIFYNKPFQSWNSYCHTSETISNIKHLGFAAKLNAVVSASSCRCNSNKKSPSPTPCFFSCPALGVWLKVVSWPSAFSIWW